ncbi:MAG: outer membrane protein assembly factor BamA [Deltaproteobacteria bacterium]|nr:outer membrane protein assembly factor BamA [Deltaproteobacteria bacterium]
MSRRRALFVAFAVALFAAEAAGQGDPVEYGAIEASAPASAELRVAVLPFRLHSAASSTVLTETLDELLAQRIEAGGEVSAVSRRGLEERFGVDLPDEDRSDAALRSLAERFGFDAMVAGSVTELAGRFSLDVRVTPADAGSASKSLVLTASSDRELLDRLGELAERVSATVRGGVPDRVVEIRFEGAGSLEAELRSQLVLRAGAVFDAAQLEADRRALSSDVRIANIIARSQQGETGVVVVYQIVRAERLLGEEVRAGSGEPVAEVLIRGNRRVEEDAIRTRIRTTPGTPYDAGQVARDVRAIFQQGLFHDVQVFVEETLLGLRVVFEVEESAVVREIAVTGNDEIDGDKIKEVLTLTTGTPLDYPLLRENVERITALYRSEGYYLAEVGYQIEEITEGSIAVEFDVLEKEKLKLREIEFVGNDAFSDGELTDGFSTKVWRFYSWATSWFDRTGTYSEPIFLRDLRLVEKKYTDNGYVQSRVVGPEVDPREEGLFLRVEIIEGPQFKVGELSVEGDETIDLEVLRKKIRLEQGDIFSRSSLTSDVETLEAHYTDRGFFFANVNPITRTDQDDLAVDVEFVVEKGPLYFVRNIDIKGNTRTVDSVIRREVRLVEGQLYSARALQVSSFRIRRLGYFEDVAFEPNTTEDPSQLDLDVNVVERPTGAFSFGAGFSSADSFIFTASLSQSNLFGRGYGANISADIGGNSSRYFVSVSDPYFLGTTFSFSATAFLTEVRFDDFEQDQQGVEVSVGHPLTIDNTASISLRYGYSQRRVTDNDNTNINSLAAPISRQVLQGRQSISRIGLSVGVDTRNDRFAPTDGYAASTSLEYAGLGGFANFLSFEGRAGYYFGAPDWLFERSTFVVSTRLGYALPFNQMSDFDLAVEGSTACADPSNCTNSGNLEDLDDDVRLPLTERYFLGGLGSTRLRGYEGRSVGPRRAELRFTEMGSGRIYHPVGTRLISNPATGEVAAICDDTPANRFGPDTTWGNGNGRCNSTGDKDDGDFDDLDETQVIGGSSFTSSSIEYRFPISEEIGLMGVGFVDGGNAFVEGDVLFDASEWRYGYGGGVLWFSPFGPLQLVLGFPIDPRSDEQSPVFEFSVGGLGI